MYRPGLLGRGVAILVGLVLAVGWHVDWFSSRRGWREATGWDEIAPEDRPDPRRVEHSGKAARSEPEILWLGHSGFLVRWQGRVLLLDPNLSRRCTIARRVADVPIEPEALGRVDAVLVSHAHFDHFDLPTLRSISRIGSLIVPSGSEDFVPPDLATGRIAVLKVDESLRIGPLEVIAVPAAHNGGRLHPLESRRLAVGYVIRSPTFTLYYSGDTGASNPFEEIGARFHPQLAILPIGAYLPRFPMKYYHLRPEEAVEAALRMGVERVIPCHFGTFTLSFDKPDWALPRFARAARQRGIEWEMPRLISRPDLAARSRRETVE